MGALQTIVEIFFGNAAVKSNIQTGIQAVKFMQNKSFLPKEASALLKHLGLCLKLRWQDSSTHKLPVDILARYSHSPNNDRTIEKSLFQALRY